VGLHVRDRWGLASAGPLLPCCGNGGTPYAIDCNSLFRDLHWLGCTPSIGSIQLILFVAKAIQDAAKACKLRNGQCRSLIARAWGSIPTTFTTGA